MFFPSILEMEKISLNMEFVTFTDGDDNPIVANIVDYSLQK